MYPQQHRSKWQFVFKMADFGKCRESFKTSWNASYMLANEFLSARAIASEDFRGIPKGQKSVDFEGRAVVLKMADFGQCQESFQTPRDAAIMLANGFLSACASVKWRFQVNSQWPEIGRFWAKSLGYSQGFPQKDFYIAVEKRSKSRSDFQGNGGPRTLGSLLMFLCHLIDLSFVLGAICGRVIWTFWIDRCWYTNGHGCYEN